MIDSVSHTTRTASAAIPALRARCTAFTQVSAGSTAEGPSAPQPWNLREMRFGHQRSAEYSPVLPACAPSRRPLNGERMTEADSTYVNTAELLALSLHHLDDADTRRPIIEIPTLDDSPCPSGRSRPWRSPWPGMSSPLGR